jgi:hypothetical protein
MLHSFLMMSIHCPALSVITEDSLLLTASSQESTVAAVFHGQRVGTDDEIGLLRYFERERETGGTETSCDSVKIARHECESPVSPSLLPVTAL